MKNIILYIIILFTWCLVVPCFADGSSQGSGSSGWWGDIDYKGKPWTRNVSRPHKLENALTGRHISLWQSHGMYFDHSNKRWKWQRPMLYGTTEDLFTQTIVVPYLIPMLESAGAVVFTPRERDTQTHEVIVDNDVKKGYYEGTRTGKWHTIKTPGFGMSPTDTLYEENPFEQGTVREVQTSRIPECSYATYQPVIPESGKYAVYVSYTTENNSIDDAHYIVYHKGVRTDFRVNQQMGGGTWVYLGTFDFDKGTSKGNRVMVTSYSDTPGVVTTDAVRFGGGMGNIAREGKLSGLPRTLEGARYYAQWAGAPRSVYAVYDGKNDYKEDINVRSLMTNWLGGGSVYNPDSANINPYDTIHEYRDSIVHIVTDTATNAVQDSIIKIETIRYRSFKGKKVPFDLSLALHSDAGYHKDQQSIFGTLAICTTDYKDSLLNAGLPREHSKELARMLLDGVKNDLTAIYGPIPDIGKGVWTSRGLRDKNYSESRLPGIPSAILEMLSHQSFPDMRLAHDPDFKFNIARAIYKSILRYEAAAHGDTVIIEPLAPSHFAVRMTDEGTAVLSWKAQEDSLEVTATPTGYNIYTSVDSLGYDNGTHVTTPLYTQPLKAGKLYRFRVTATNDGGESFPTEELCAYYVGREGKESRESRGSKTILIVNGFNRLSSPAVVDTIRHQGFDMAEDPGLTYGPTGCWYQALGKIVAGNDFDYVGEHAEAIKTVGEYNIESCSRQAVEQGIVDLNSYDCVDLLLGNEKDDGHSLRPYKTFTTALQSRLKELRKPIIISGSYIASDMQSTPEDSAFLADVLHCTLDTIVRTVNDSVTFSNQTVSLIHTLNANHYATTQSDVLKPIGEAQSLIQYSDGSCAAVSIPEKLIVVGFPLECIESKQRRAQLLQQILK